MGKIITVFGSSIPRVGDEEYETAYHLGKEIGGRGYSVCSGGYQGIMDAVSKGASETGQKAIGVTVDIFNAQPGAYLTEEIKCHTLFERLNKLTELGDAFIVLKGGTGTMVELSLVWEMLNKGLIGNRPIVCHGNLWNDVVTLMEERIKIEKRKTGLVKCFSEIDECINFIFDTLS